MESDPTGLATRTKTDRPTECIWQEAMRRGWGSGGLGVPVELDTALSLGLHNTKPGENSGLH
jgi:hypothetical protein